MRLGELVFRAAAGLGAFLVGIAHCLLLAVIPRMGCATPDNDPYFASFALGLPLGVLIALASAGLRFRSLLRWFTLPLALLVPLAVRAVLPYLDEAALAGMHVCSATRGWAAATDVTAWHRAWAPVQLCLLLALSVQAARYWLPPTAGERARA